MSTTDPSQYIELLITPDDSNGLTFGVQSKQLPLAALPGKKRIHVSLMEGRFAGAGEQGGTGHGEGYTGFDLAEPVDASSEFTLQIENLQPDAATQLIQGVATVVLEEQQITLRDNAQQPVEIDVAGAAVTLAEVHFVVVTLTPQLAFSLKQGTDLATITSTASVPTRVCIASRDTAPLGLRLLPGSRYLIVRAAPNAAVPPMDLTFHLPTDQDPNTAPEAVGIFIRRFGAWEKLSAATLATDRRSIRVSTTGQNTFALSVTPPAL